MAYKPSSKKPNTAEMQTVFDCLCFMSCNIEDWDVFTSKLLAERTGLSRYKVLKILNRWKELGMVERGSMGFPAEFSYGEVVEMIHDAYPPINGWKLTENGRKTQTYKNAYTKFMKSFEEWANGE